MQSRQPFHRPPFEALLKRRFFYTEAFELYRTAPNYKGDNRGLYDYGPPGCALLANMVAEWRRHFVTEENMFELDCTAITPEVVLKTSGHVEKFADWMCRDPVKGDYLRADHLVETVLQSRLEKSEAAGSGGKDVAEKLDDATVQQYKEILARIDNYDGNQLGQLIHDLAIRNPNGNSPVEPPLAFNLMFQSRIGPSASHPVFLRPETAQGQFLHFRRLLDLAGGTLPFASACVGRAYRNEIAPRSGLLRVRELLLAEAEHYVDPASGKRHPRFAEAAGLRLPLLDRQTQMAGRADARVVPLGEAVAEGTVDSETLGYFLARIYLFLVRVGVDGSRVRFRQHMDNEMAHYACDCWDAELRTSYGWVECVGCADRSAYDLSAHAAATGTPLTVREPLAEPRRVTAWTARLEKKLLGPRFKRDASKVVAAVAALDQSTLEGLAGELAEGKTIKVEVKEAMADGRTTAELSSEVCEIKQVTSVETMREYTPNVIEPAFGIGRILYCVLEHVYWHRPNDTAREVLSLPIHTAPTKVLLLPLSNHPSLKPLVAALSRRFRALGIASSVDAAGVSIGRRYARNDEVGTPLAVTVDFASLEDGSVTLRERDSTAQVRAPEEEVVRAVRNLVAGVEGWEDVARRLPAFAGQAAGEE